MLATVESVTRYVTQMGSRLPEDLIRNNAREMAAVIARYHPWDYRSTEGQITAVADYTTGTVAVTQGAKALTFTGSTLTAAMITRHIQMDGTAGRWYQFRSIDTAAGTAVLMDPYEGATITAGAITIRQRYYRLPPDFDKEDVSKESAGNKVVWWKTRREFERDWGTISASGQTYNLVPAGASRTVLYSTGTFTAIQASTTITIATGTPLEARDLNRRFRAPLFPHLGDFEIVAVSGAVYTLDRAWSEIGVSTQIYQVDPIGEPMIEAYPAPGGGNSSIRFYYFRVPPPLFLETDYPTWPAEMNEVWKEVTLLRCFAPKPSDFEAEFGVLMGNFMKRQGLVANEVVPSGRWGMRNRAGSNLPWNFPATRFTG